MYDFTGGVCSRLACKPHRRRAQRSSPCSSLSAPAVRAFHKRRPDLELSVEHRPWRVRCGWVLPPAGEPTVTPGPRADGWAWAMDSDQRRLIVTGRLEGGFFRVEAVRAAPRTKTIATSSRCPLDSNRKLLTERQIRSRRFPNDSYDSPRGSTLLRSQIPKRGCGIEEEEPMESEESRGRLPEPSSCPRPR
jgi:hypothetical protein